MALLVRTTAPAPIGGNLDDVQVACRVEVVDEDTGLVVDSDWLQFSAKGLNHDRATAEAVTQQAADAWAKANAERIEAKLPAVEAKAVYTQTVKFFTDAIAATPDIVLTKAELADAKAELIAESVAEVSRK